MPAGKPYTPSAYQATLRKLRKAASKSGGTRQAKERAKKALKAHTRSRSKYYGKAKPGSLNYAVGRVAKDVKRVATKNPISVTLGRIVGRNRKRKATRGDMSTPTSRKITKVRSAGLAAGRAASSAASPPPPSNYRPKKKTKKKAAKKWSVKHTSYPTKTAKKKTKKKASKKTSRRSSVNRAIRYGLRGD